MDGRKEEIRKEGRKERRKAYLCAMAFLTAITKSFRKMKEGRNIKNGTNERKK